LRHDEISINLNRPNNGHYVSIELVSGGCGHSGITLTLEDKAASTGSLLGAGPLQQFQVTSRIRVITLGKLSARPGPMSSQPTCAIYPRC
jgi:hypothetical protein